MTLAFSPPIRKKEAGVTGFSLGLRACDRFCEPRLLSRRCVLLDDAGLCRLVDRLIGLGKRFLGSLRVGRDELAYRLGCIGERALAADIEDALPQGCAMGLFR